MGRPVPITIERVHTERDWSEARQLLLEYADWAVPAAGIVTATDVQPHYEEELGDPSAYYTRRGSVVLVARDGDCSVGIVGLHFQGEVAEVVRMYVRPGARGRGIAVALLDAVKKVAARRGARRLYLETDPISMAGAVRLYERYGFRMAGGRQLGPLPVIGMDLVLADSSVNSGA
jgi:GNAT superfamily N-acetyltransferase